MINVLVRLPIKQSASLDFDARLWGAQAGAHQLNHEARNRNFVFQQSNAR